MAYGTIKVDTVTFTNDGVDKSITLSGLVQNPTFSGNVTVTGTFSGVTVTGTTASFTSGNFTNISGGTHTITSGVFAAGSAASPSITFTGDLNTGIYSPGADQVAISTGGSGRLFVDASGRVGIGTSGPGFPLEVRATSSTGQVQILGSDNTNATWRLATPSSSVVAFGGALTHAVAFGGFDNTTQAFSERARIDSSGRILVGTSSARSNYRNSLVPNIQLEEAGAEGGLAVFHNANAATGPLIWLGKSRGTAAGSSTVVQDGDTLGAIRFNGADGANVILGAQIGANVDGAPGTNDLPTRLVFSTTANGASSPTERLRITSAGLVGIGTSSPVVDLDVAPAASTATFRIHARSNTTPVVAIELVRGTNTTFGADGSGDYRIKNDTGNLSLEYGDGGVTTERARIDSSGRLLVGTSSAETASLGGLFQIQAASGIASALIKRNDNGALPSYLYLGKSRGTTVNSTTIVQDGDSLGAIRFTGADGSTEVGSIAAQITAAVDGTPGSGDMPGRLVFGTTADGASSPTERLRITSAGVLQVADAGNIAVGTTTGTKIGTATTQKLGFFNKTPVVQPAAVADATDAASVITQLNALLARMRDLGLIAT
jgi:hypothetical protein